MEDRWEKLRQIIREENNALEERILAAIKKTKPKIELINGRWVGITDDQMQAWYAAYPGVDLKAELNRAAAWCVSNPATAPVKQMGRYINNWLSTEQNRRALRSIPTERKTATPPSLCAYCLNPSVGAVSGRRHCRDHAQNAMDGDAPPKMPGIVAKAVAGD